MEYIWCTLYQFNSLMLHSKGEDFCINFIPRPLFPYISVNEFCRLTLPLRQKAVSSQQQGMVSLGLVMENENVSLPLKEVPVRVEENGYVLKLDCSMITTMIYPKSQAVVGSWRLSTAEGSAQSKRHS